ncbi:hypothetical protein CCMSSC00406_0003007 [Pleurotus cornucopiae]|uniref:Uncharacterized protein n=1 Tax=Pleurotus cornucopiae TaxID=5321 RepID=A0ACB7J6S5_PLECO|nr:hypothetical protein CCMSSC00406_0003007 [Pleurotus cornucopiae]
MSSSQPIALPSTSNSHHNHSQYHHHSHSFSNPQNPSNPGNSYGNGQAMDYGNYHTRGDSIMTSGSYTGSSNGDDFNPASYTKHYMGSPLSWRSGSFGSRHVSGNAFYAGSPTAHLLSGFGSHEFKGGKMASMESEDRNSILNAVNLFESGREEELCRDYTCCGLHLPDLHALLDHFEEVHIVVVDANGNPVTAANGNHIPNGADGGTMRVAVSIPFNPQCNNPPLTTNANSSAPQSHASSISRLQSNFHSSSQDLGKHNTPTQAPYVPDYFAHSQHSGSQPIDTNHHQPQHSQSDLMQPSGKYAGNDMAYREGVPIDPDDMEMEMEESLAYPPSGHYGGHGSDANPHAYGSMSPPSSSAGTSSGMQGVSNSPSPPSSNSPSSTSGHGMPSPSSGVPTPPDTPITTPLSAYPSPRMGTFPPNLTPGKRALQHHGSHQSFQTGHRSLHHKISLQHIHQERLQQSHRTVDARGVVENARGVYASAPPSPHPGHVRNSWSHLHPMRGSSNNSLDGALGEDTNSNNGEANNFESALTQPSAAGMAAGGASTFPLNFDVDSGGSFGNDGVFSDGRGDGNFERAPATAGSAGFDLDMMGSPSMPGSPNHAQTSIAGLSTSPSLTRHASLGSLGFSSVASSTNPSAWNGSRHSASGAGVPHNLSLHGLNDLDSAFGGVIHSEPTSPYVQQSHGSAFTNGAMNFGLHRMNSIDGAIMGGLSGMNALHAAEMAPACVPPALLFSSAGTANPTPVGSRSASPIGVKGKGKGKKTGSPSGRSNAVDGADVASSSKTASQSGAVGANGGAVIRPAPLANSAASALQSQSVTRPAASMLLSKPFRCPKPNCNKSYKQANGLKYHMTHGSCNFAPPKDIELRDRLLEARRREGIESNPGSTPGSGASTPIPGGAVVPDPLGLGTISELELREVEKEAERRLRPFACGIGDCPRRYKNMNGLRYHYQHSGDHGAMGLALLASGQHRCLARNSDKNGEREGRRAMASAPTSRSNSRASSTNRGVVGPSGNGTMNGMSYTQVYSSNGTYSPSVGANGTVNGVAPMSSPLSQGGFSSQQEYAIQQVQAQAVQMPMNVVTAQQQQPVVDFTMSPQQQQQSQPQPHPEYSQQMQVTQAQLAYQAQYAELQRAQYHQQQQQASSQLPDQGEFGGVDINMT